jgi:hypothetical protein
MVYKSQFKTLALDQFSIALSFVFSLMQDENKSLNNYQYDINNTISRLVTRFSVNSEL